MADEWFVERDGQNFGPYSPAQLRSMTATGQLLPVDRVRKGGEGPWKPASQVKGLFAAPAVASLPMPMPTPTPTSALPAARVGGSPFADLHSPPGSALWAKIVGGVGLAVVLIGLLCPWYASSSHASVDTSGFNSPGMNFPSQGGRGGFGGGGGGFSNAGFGNAGGKQDFNTSASVTGLLSLPGVLAFLLTVGIGATFFLPKRLFVLIATGLTCLLLLTILGSFLHGPSLDESKAFGGAGFGASASAKAGTSWGQFVSLLGDLTLLTMGVLILLRVATVPPRGGDAVRAGELSLG